MRTEKSTIFSKYTVVLSFRESVKMDRKKKTQISGQGRVGSLIMCLYSRQEPLHKATALCYIYLKIGGGSLMKETKFKLGVQSNIRNNLQHSNIRKKW